MFFFKYVNIMKNENSRLNGCSKIELIIILDDVRLLFNKYIFITQNYYLYITIDTKVLLETNIIKSKILINQIPSAYSVVYT